MLTLNSIFFVHILFVIHLHSIFYYRLIVNYKFIFIFQIVVLWFIPIIKSDILQFSVGKQLKMSATFVHTVYLFTLFYYWHLFSTNIILLFQKHRVTIPEHSKTRTRARHSIAFFVHPDDATVIDPMTFIKPKPVMEIEGPKRHIALITAYHHWQRRLKQSYAWTKYM